MSTIKKEKPIQLFVSNAGYSSPQEMYFTTAKQTYKFVSPSHLAGVNTQASTEYIVNQQFLDHFKHQTILKGSHLSPINKQLSTQGSHMFTSCLCDDY